MIGVSIAVFTAFHAVVVALFIPSHMPSIVVFSPLKIFSALDFMAVHMPSTSPLTAFHISVTLAFMSFHTCSTAVFIAVKISVALALSPFHTPSIAPLIAFHTDVVVDLMAFHALSIADFRALKTATAVAFNPFHMPSTTVLMEFHAAIACSFTQSQCVIAAIATAANIAINIAATGFAAIRPINPLNPADINPKAFPNVNMAGVAPAVAPPITPIAPLKVPTNPAILPAITSTGPMAAAISPTFTIKFCICGSKFPNQFAKAWNFCIAPCIIGNKTVCSDVPKSAPVNFKLFMACFTRSIGSNMSCHVESTDPAAFSMAFAKSSAFNAPLSNTSSMKFPPLSPKALAAIANFSS